LLYQKKYDKEISIFDYLSCFSHNVIINNRFNMFWKNRFGVAK
jgi:hypothetical protein